MKKQKRNLIAWAVIGVIVFVGLVWAAFYFVENKADASVIANDPICPQINYMSQNWCSDGTVVQNTPTPDGCPVPPSCVRSPQPMPPCNFYSSPVPGASITPCVTTRTPIPSVTSTTACGTSNGVALPCASPPSCPELQPMMPEWCSDGTIQNQPNDTNGCPRVPLCIKDKVTYSLTNGFNLIVVPEYMYRNTNPISSSAFSGMTLYNYSNGNWQINPTYLRQNGSYLVRNRDNAKSITIQGSGMQAVGAYLGQSIYKGWNMMANNSDTAKLLSELTYKTYVPDPNCTTPPACGEHKTLAQLFTDNRLYSRIYFFNDLTSNDPNVFYSTKILSSADLSSYRIPAKAGFWVYLYQ